MGMAALAAGAAFAADKADKAGKKGEAPASIAEFLIKTWPKEPDNVRAALLALAKHLEAALENKGGRVEARNHAAAMDQAVACLNKLNPDQGNDMAYTVISEMLVTEEQAKAWLRHEKLVGSDGPLTKPDGDPCSFIK